MDDVQKMKVVKAEYDRLKDDLETLIASCERPEQAVWEMIRRTAILAAGLDIPLHEIVDQLRDEYQTYLFGETGHDGMN